MNSITMGQFSEIQWPAEYNELTRIEELLHCRICYEYIETSVITPCSHNYCSLCIRKFLQYKTQCPVCFETIYEKDLHANRILDEFMESYLSLREKLLACIKSCEFKQGDESRSNETPVVNSKTPDKRNGSQFFLQKTPNKIFFRDNSDQSPKSSISIKDSQIIMNKTPSNKTATNFGSSSFSSRESQISNTPKRNVVSGSLTSDSKTPKINSIFSMKSEERIRPEAKNVKKVPCPVCSVEISETNINRHLDDCLKRQRSMSPPKNKNKNDLQPMPKYVLNLMKDSELRKLLKKYGLSTAGTRKTMEKRLQKFSALYNSERDKISPKSIEELVKLCEGEENAERNIFKQNPLDLIPSIDRKADLSLIEKAHKEYLERNKDDYQKLIETINQREKGGKKPNRSLFGFKTGEESIGVASTSSASQATTSYSFLNRSDEVNDTNSSAAGDMSNWFPNDSNSTNASYPLQHYSNDDPMRFLALEISSDSPESKIKSETVSPSRNDTPISWKANTESSVNSSEVLNSSNQRLTSSRAENIDINVSNYDLFDASTEDNLSDSLNRGEESGKNKSKKVLTKRFKAEENCRFTDSETDVETSPRYSGLKTTKTRKRGGKRKEEKIKENGKETREKKKSDIGFESEAEVRSEVPSKSIDKENCKEDLGSLMIARRSSRKRSHVSYAASTKRGDKKPLDELHVNFEDSSRDGGTFLITENTAQPANPTMRSLRKRTKR